MRRRHRTSPKVNNALYFLAGMLTVVLAFIIVVGVQTTAQGTRYDYGMPDNMSGNMPGNISVGGNAQQENGGQNNLEKWQEGVVEYKGTNYRYNSNIRSYLFMGIDNDNWVEEAPDGVSGGQSDAMFLLVADSGTQKLSVISINRNTMTEIDVYDADGNFVASAEGQICLQHAFGDGRRLSCSRSMDVVAELFGNIPISGYLSMNMGGIPIMNDAVGGVEVTVLQDLKVTDKGVNLRAGETRTLTGVEAYCYLRGRDVKEFDSASDRLRREEQYINNYMKKLTALAGSNPSMVVGVYRSIADYLVTSVDFTDLITELMDYEFSEARMYTVPGEATMGERFEEYYIDEEAFQDLIYEVFYTKI